MDLMKAKTKKYKRWGGNPACVRTETFDDTEEPWTYENVLWGCDEGL